MGQWQGASEVAEPYIHWLSTGYPLFSTTSSNFAGDHSAGGGWKGETWLESTLRKCPQLNKNNVH